MEISKVNSFRAFMMILLLLALRNVEVALSVSDPNNQCLKFFFIGYFILGGLYYAFCQRIQK
jgi:hypothetical protein